MHADLRGKVAIVTGGAGILGSRFCRVLAENGARVALVDSNKESAERVVAELLQQSTDLEIHPFQCDVSDKFHVARLMDEILSRYGTIDILHNNAATKTDILEAFFQPFESYDLDVWKEVMSTNIDGMFLMAQAFGNLLINQRKGGVVIQTSSIYGVVAPDQRIYEGSKYCEVPINTPAVYSVSKAAVLGLTKYLAAYWGDRGIRVNAISPGGVESGQNDTFQMAYSSRAPLGRMALPSEMEGALLFLASDASSYITGHNIVVDGGWSCW